MNILDIIMISISLAMDAFTVSIIKSSSTVCKRYILILPMCFSVFQMIMPLLGFFFGNMISSYVTQYDHWISFLLLSIIGLEMIFSSKNYDSSFSIFSLLLLSIATSIDAFCIGITFSFYTISLSFIIFMIGFITLVLCFIGCLIGYYFGNFFHSYTPIIGGSLLIIIGFKILNEHIGILSFLC